jgi:chromate transporter
MTGTASTENPHSRIAEVVPYFLRLGLLGFGGPVALVAQMERELTGERGWMTKEQMREAIAICQTLPGPLAIQVGIYISYLRAGFWGAWAGGWAFILPNFLIVAALGALYLYFGDLKPVTAIFYGVSPAVIALILHSCYRLAKLGMEDWMQWLIAAVCLVVTIVLQSEVALLFISAGVVSCTTAICSNDHRSLLCKSLQPPCWRRLHPWHQTPLWASCCCSSSRQARSHSGVAW